MANEVGGWIQTYSGGRIYPLDPDINDIDIRDIAHALSLQCRYAGHCKKFYSVAEHCLILSETVDPKYALDALMHDASEAFLVDIPRPIKPYLAGYYENENKLMTQIAIKFGFTWPMLPQVQEYDTRILNDEKAANCSVGQYKWDYYGEPLGIKLKFLSPEEAEKAFLERFFELTNNKTPISGV